MIIKKKKTRFLQKEVIAGPPLLMVAVLAVYLAVGWFLVTHVYQRTLDKSIVSFGRNFTDPDSYHNLDLREAAKVTYSSPAILSVKNLPNTKGLRHQIISFRVPEDNLVEYGLMSLPAAPAPKNGYPLIILCHAYYNPYNYQTDRGYINDMDFYTQHGFAVIKPDFRGQGLSRNQGQPESAYYSMAYNIDIMSLIAATKSTTYLNKDAINLWGHSMGAYIAFRAAVLSPDVKSAILLSGPVGRFDEMYKDYSAPSDRANPIAAKIRAGMLLRHGTPLVDPSYWDHASPINFLDDAKARFQIHVGTADKVVPPKFSAELDLALTSLGRPHQYFVYAKAKHNLVKQRPLIWDRSLGVLQKD